MQYPPYNLLCDQWIELLDQLNIGAFTADLHWQVTAINRSATSLLGLEEDEVVGRDCREVFSGVPCMVRCLLRPGAELRQQEPEVAIPNEEGGNHLVTRLATPIYGPQGRMAGCLTILQDHSPIADLINRVHYEERSLKVILDNLDIGIYTLNRGGLITFFNRAADTISGYSRRDVLGKSCAAFFDPESPRALELLQETMNDGRPRTSPRSKMVTREGELIPVRADYMPLQNEQGGIVGGLVTLQDLTLTLQLDQVISDRYTFRHMIGKDPSMQKIFELVNVVAESDATILIEGPTGTGKDLLAKVIHSASRRTEKPFVKVNCAAMPDNLLESEMFGYIKGAFTGANRDKPGRFQEADGGTIFLDEIGDLPLSLQAKLLRVLEDREFYPLGSRHTVKVDVRIISATNRGLESLVRRRLFREDLFYRLNVLRMELPPLKRVHVPDGPDTPVRVATFEPIVGRKIEIEADLVVLAGGIVPALPAALAHAFGATLDADGFFQEAESKWRPVDALKEGVFACGLALSPRSISESIASGEAAAMRALRILSHRQLSAGRVTAKVHTSLCSLCERCIETCPYDARFIDDELEAVQVNPAMCQGCGACSAVCPNGAAFVEGYRTEQMLEVIDAAIGMHG